MKHENINWENAPEGYDVWGMDFDKTCHFFKGDPTRCEETGVWVGAPSVKDVNPPAGLDKVFWRLSLRLKPETPQTMPKKHPHYHKPTNGAETVDVYWVLNAWGVECHAVGHAVKKLLNAGQRGAKSKAQDLQEAIDSIKRAIELSDADE